MRIVIVGGIFGTSAEYRRLVTRTPETVLADGLRVRGHEVAEHSHTPPFDFHGYDVVHVHHLAAGAVAAASARPIERIAFTAHWFRHADLRRRAAMRFVMSRAGALVALSPSEARWQRIHFPGVDGRQYVIPNGIDAEIFRFVPPRTPAHGEPWRLLFVGQLARFKGVDVLLRALMALPTEIRVELDLVYQVTDEEASLREAARELKLDHVRFLGPRSPEQLARLYAQSHVFVLPSMGEALPSVVSEAIFVGRPVVGTAVGGVPEQIGDFGAVVSPGDEHALARAIAGVLREYRKHAAVALERSEAAQSRFSIATMIAAHERMYERIVAEPVPQRSYAESAVDRMARAATRAFGATR